MIEPSIREAYEAGKQFRDLLQRASVFAEPMVLRVVRPDGRTREGRAWIQGARGDRLTIVRPPYEKAEA